MNTDFFPDTAEGPAGLYLHIPFCRGKCPYCSFLSLPAVPGDGLIADYVAALSRQAAEMAAHPWAAARSFASLYIGGGTPTICEPHDLAGLLAGCLAQYRFVCDSEQAVEATVEANPNTVTAEMLGLLRAAGANRLSIGVQSFTAASLAALGRSHSRAEAISAVGLAREAGFTNISLDLMYGLPGQRLADWEETLAMTISLAPEHLSLYELTIEPDTAFSRQQASGRLTLPSEETALQMAAASREKLAAAGYLHYEISNFCRPGYHCRHNINYWRNGSYLGLGAGAVSNFTGLRLKNITDPSGYIRRVKARRPVFLEGEGLDRAAAFRETVIMGLRMTGGVCLSQLAGRFGLTPEAYYGTTLERLADAALVAVNEGHMYLTARGLELANQVLAELV